MILPLFLWITRQKAAQEQRGGIGCGSGRDSAATPDRRAGQGGSRPHRRDRPPLGPRYVTENSAVPGHRRTAAKARKCQLGGRPLRRIRGEL